MFTGESLIGRRVLARKEGQMLDSVKDIVIDTAQRRVVALLIHEGRLFGAPTVVPLEKVLSIGDDAIVVTDAGSAMAVDQYPMVKEILDRNDRLVGKVVYTEAGSEIGKVVDVAFELPAGNITEVKVASRSDDDRPVANVGIPVADVISIGPNAVVITSPELSGVGGQGAPQQSVVEPATQDAPPTTLIGDETGAAAWSPQEDNTSAPQDSSVTARATLPDAPEVNEGPDADSSQTPTK